MLIQHLTVRSAQSHGIDVTSVGKTGLPHRNTFRWASAAFLMIQIGTWQDSKGAKPYTRSRLVHSLQILLQEAGKHLAARLA